ncbi:MAG: trypsin-like serine protease [Chloroflexi bacterium]|nr:trypsin-like serine protease [Chloroflexota bacterium]
MTFQIRMLTLLLLIAVIAGILVSCIRTPAAPANRNEALSITTSIADAEGVAATNASWYVPPDVDRSSQNLANRGASSDTTPSFSSEIDADAVVAAYEKVIGDVHENVLPSVVSIFVLNRVQVSGSVPGFTYPFPFGQRQPQSGDSQQEFFYRNGQGSGFVWDTQGHIVTNRHVVVDAERISVQFSDGSSYIAEVVGLDQDSDLAVIRVERDAEQLTAVSLGDSNEVRVGQLAITIGNPFGQEFTTTTGIVSAIGRTLRTGDSQFSLPKVIQTDAPMNPGNSGGPLLDRQGQVIGVDAQIITRSGSNTGIGFAIPVNMAKQVVPVLISEGSFTYSWLGIRGTTVTPEAVDLMGAPEGTRGAQVIALAKDGPAHIGGLIGSTKSKSTSRGNIRYGGDVITSIDGQPVLEMTDLIVYLLENTRPGDTVAVRVVREGGEVAEIKVTLDARPELLN